MRVIALAEIREKLAAIGFEPIASTPAEFSNRIRTEIPKWATIVKASGARPE